MEAEGGAADALRRNYRLGKTLGHGSFGKVKIAEHVRTGHKVAIKIINRRKMGGPEMEEKVRREIKICRLFVHPHVIRLYEVIETPTDIYVIMEHVVKGELFDYIVERGRLQEDEARHFFQQISREWSFCHRNMVVHRCFWENFMLGLKWMFGAAVVILYALLCGALPFDDENIPNLFKKIKSGMYTLPSHLSAGARDLIPRMLVVDPLKRITTHDIRKHPWFKVNLPRYLAVTPPNATEHLKRLDDEIIQEGTVAYIYYWTSGPHATGYLSASIQEKFILRDLIQILMHKPFQVDGNSSPWISRKKPMGVGIQFLTFATFQSPARPGTTSISTNGSQPSSAVKFEIQLYKTSEVEYVLDLQRLSGPVFLFLDFCAYFMMRLEFISMLTSDKKFVTSM
ncbi:hypothetical protein SASPL_157450 [Salvia splendens]|uniref:non-specific serine/threonine protein kinase n=1 Tax=Salvia splendens TaxID=180675 RepID=A0A8X8YWC9_SALSN|nr:hypothetical protein SASPL_157450 [Salvia splendens]